MSILAEKTGVTKPAIYVLYITTFLRNFPEFNSALNSPQLTDAHYQDLQNELCQLKAPKKELSLKNLELKLDLRNTKEKLEDINE